MAAVSLGLAEHVFGALTEAAAKLTGQPLHDVISGVRVALDDGLKLRFVDDPDAGLFGDDDIGAGLLGIDHVHLADGFAGTDVGKVNVVAMGMAVDGGLSGEHDGKGVVVLALRGEPGLGLQGFEASGRFKGATDIVGEFGEQPEGGKLDWFGFWSHKDEEGGALFRPAWMKCNLSGKSRAAGTHAGEDSARWTPGAGFPG